MKITMKDKEKREDKIEIMKKGPIEIDLNTQKKFNKKSNHNQ